MLSRDIPHEVLNYRLDLGAISSCHAMPSLQATEILKDELTLVVHPKHLLAKGSAKSMSPSLEKKTSSRTASNRPFGRRVIELLRETAPRSICPLKCPPSKASSGFVQMGMGVAIVPRMCVEWEIEHGWMKEVKVRQLNMPRHVYFVSRRGARLPHAASEFMRILREE